MALKGFDTETAPLTTEERNILLPFLVSKLRNNVGKNNSVTSTRIIAGFKAAGHTLTSPRLRKLIHHARTEGLLPTLIATSNGYYMALSWTELQDYANSLRGREEAIRNVRLVIESQLPQQMQPDISGK